MLKKDEIKQLINEFKPVFATKDDLKEFAKKADLTDFAAKADISELKQEISRVRTDLSLEIRLNAEELARMVNAGFDNLQEKIETGRSDYRPRRI